MSSIRKLDRVSPEHYFAYEDSIEGRAEYYHGLIVDMAGGSTNHSNISLSIGSALMTVTRGNGCKVFGPDIKILTDGSYLHPDVAVVCGDLEVSSLRKDIVQNPILIVEVLSEYTSTRDRGEKFELYQQLESLREYVLVEQNVAQIYVFTKSATGEWVYNVFTGMNASLRLSSLGVEISLANIYYDVDFESSAIESEP